MRFYSYDRLFLFSYFLGHISVGAGLLWLPFSWAGEKSVSFLDALFTAVSAVCVTGLTTLPTADFSRFGQIVILLLIQAGGLGIISFAALYLFFPRSRISLSGTKVIRAYYLQESKASPKHIIRTILLVSVSIELVGFLFLSIAFFQSGAETPLFAGLFHAVSAFCNAGFSLFQDSLRGYHDHFFVSLTMMSLIAIGGAGFMVLQDCIGKLNNRRFLFSFHTRMMFLGTAGLITLGTLFYFFTEQSHTLSGQTLPKRMIAALFQSVTTRTAGFYTIEQSELGLGSQLGTLLLMFIGAGAGSTGGGIKVTTFLLLLLVLIRGVREEGDTRVLGRRIPNKTVMTAALLFLKAVVFVVLSALILFLVERHQGHQFKTMSLVFESVSAFGTVGLSQGVTPFLSSPGKLIIMVTMFVGRVGFFSIVMPIVQGRQDRKIDYPTGEVLLG